jgi:hypothetical protein
MQGELTGMSLLINERLQRGWATIHNLRNELAQAGWAQHKFAPYEWAVYLTDICDMMLCKLFNNGEIIALTGTHEQNQILTEWTDRGWPGWTPDGPGSIAEILALIEFIAAVDCLSVMDDWDDLEIG